MEGYEKLGYMALNVSDVKADWQDKYKKAVACTAGSSGRRC